MHSLFSRFLCFCSVIGATFVYAVPIVGVVVEEGSDRTVSYVRISYVSGKELGSTDRLGRFELDVERSNAILILTKAGYDTTRVELQDYGDLLDLVISVRSSVRALGQTTVRGRLTPTWQRPAEVAVGALEDAAGMRFDLAEHLSQLPGMSGQRDFSSQLSYDGSRPEDVAYHLGQVKIPNMRHLDVGLPGNLSVVNPHVLQGIQVQDHYGEGPLSQDLAASIQFVPDPGSSDEMSLRSSMGTTMREFYASGPWLFWNSFVVSFRWLDGAMLKNMGEKFFTEFKKRDASCTDCHVESSENAFDLSAWDLYAAFQGADASGARWGLRTVLSQDQYAVNQDTSSELSEVGSATLVEGHQEYRVIALDYETAEGMEWHVGWVLENRGDTLRDTSAFRSLSEAQGDEKFRNFIDGGERNHSWAHLGAADQLNGRIGGGVAGWAVDYQYHQLERTFPAQGRLQKPSQSGHWTEAVTRMRWRQKDHESQIAAGISSDLDEVVPLISAHYERQCNWLPKGRWFVSSALRSQPKWIVVHDTIRSDSIHSQLDGLVERAGNAQLGFALNAQSWSMHLHGYGRYYPNPLLPEPDALSYLTEVQKADDAWVSGAALNVQYRTLHHFAVQVNAGRVYGEYHLKEGGSLPWEANAKLDLVTHFRYYPRSDSLISLIVSHRAAWGRPLYQWEILSSGHRRIHLSPLTEDLYRTDVRVNLDLISRWKPLKDVRFYVEVDNVLEPLPWDWADFLGTDNARQRSMVVVDDDGKADNGYVLTPFMAKGMGLYVQFGVEGNFGF